ncbi:NAD-dependent protein deacetylase [Halobacteriales archaeon QS_8_69_26]|nr:MAG: NAD-dependent protein deacetylase [Halobacteriales archaeon QS_8_69_26]
MDEGDDYRAAARALADADVAAALTGAGVSTESGVPDFRSEGGVWDEYDERDFTIARFQRDPDAFWTDWLDLQEGLIPDDVEPNPAHESLAALEEAGLLDAVITQNVDGLHQDAGSRTVVEIHGSGARASCRGCGASFDAAVARERAREAGGAPACENCGDVLKPDAVLFGERLPDAPLRGARRWADESEAFLVVGSSLTVEPAASLPRRAADGATLVEVNTESTTASSLAAYTFREKAGEAIPELASAAVELQG